jgi:hypothetical protein
VSERLVEVLVVVKPTEKGIHARIYLPEKVYSINKFWDYQRVIMFIARRAKMLTEDWDAYEQSCKIYAWLTEEDAKELKCCV